jgi:hypothetical protein
MEIITNTKVFKPKDILIDNIIFKKQYCVGNDIYNYPIKYLLKDLVIQTPIIYIPFGINSYNNKKYLDISLLNNDTDSDMKLFKKMIEHINKISIKKINRKIKFINSIKKSPSSFYSDRLRLCINEKILVFNDQKTKISFDCIQQKLYSKLLISPKCIWRSPTNFGITWDILQMKIYDKLILYEYSFIDDEDNNSNTNTPYNYENDAKYNKYFKMIKMGVPYDGVQQRMIIDKLDPSILDKQVNLKPTKIGNNRNTKLDVKPNKITPSMILGVKLNKINKKEKDKETKPIRHLNPLISLDEILLKKSLLKKSIS